MKKNILTITLLASVIFTGALSAETANPKKADRMKNITRLTKCQAEEEAAISQRRGAAGRSQGRYDRRGQRQSDRSDFRDDRQEGREGRRSQRFDRRR